MITISGKTLGKKKPLFTDWSLPLPPDLGDDGATTLRDLIGTVVRNEVVAFKERQEQRRTFRALTAADIEKGVVKGKIEMGGSDLKQEVDEEEAVGTALQAFEDGLYLVILDGEEKKDLEQQIYLREDSRVTFVRLAMLAGG